jgi:hypothetical protein
MLNFSLVTTFLISAGLMAVLLFNTNPFQASSFAICLFFISLLAFLFSIFSMVSFAIRKYFKKIRSNIKIIRRSLLLSCLITGLLAFSALKVLNVMSAITFLIALILLEFFFSSKKIERETK